LSKGGGKVSTRVLRQITAAALVWLSVAPALLRADDSPTAADVSSDDSSSTQEDLDQVPDQYSQLKQELEDRFANPPIFCSNPADPISKRVDPPKACSRFYDRLFNKPTLNVTVAFGYADNETGPGNWSDAMYADFLQKATQPCSLFDRLRVHAGG
jgi:hypothetical protein